MVSWLVNTRSYMVDMNMNSSRRRHHEDTPQHLPSPSITFPSHHTPPINSNSNSNATINSNCNSNIKCNSNSNSLSCKSTVAVPPSPVGARVRALPCRAVPYLHGCKSLTVGVPAEDPDATRAPVNSVHSQSIRRGGDGDPKLHRRHEHRQRQKDVSQSDS